MKALLNPPRERMLLTDTTKSFSVVLAFDDPRARQKAIQVCSNLKKEFGAEFDFQCRQWRFADLEPTNQAEDAARVASGADMVIFACSNEKLPDKIRLWIEMWLAKKATQETALVALIGTSNPQGRPATPAHAYLEQVARQTGMSYFAAEFYVPRPISGCSIEAIVARATTVTSVLGEVLHRPPPPPRWGINE
jgi:hypothetical protein